MKWSNAILFMLVTVAGVVCAYYHDEDLRVKWSCIHSESPVSSADTRHSKCEVWHTSNSEGQDISVYKCTRVKKEP